MVTRLGTAWKTPARDFAQPDQGTRPEDLALMRRHLHGAEPDADVARKEKAYAAYVDELSNAWKRPGIQPQRSVVGPGPSGLIKAASSGDPAERAEEIERLGERTRGGR
jgi:hypothetical protein